MIKEFIATGKTIEEATQLAKLGLAAPLTADVKTEVLQMPKKGFLGIGSKDAQVKVSYDDGKSEKKAPKKKPAKNQGAKKEAPKQNTAIKEAPAVKDSQQAAPAPVKKEVKAEPKKEKDYPQSVDLEYAKNYLAQIVKGLEVDDANISATYEQGVITMELECEDYGIIIGRRGETLDSIQYLISLAMKKMSNGYVRVVINVGNYREKRNETLKHLARKHAAYVLRSGRRYTFEPMNPYERRIVHTTIQEIEGVESRSIGYNQDRRVVIEPVGGVKNRSNNQRSNSRPRSSAPAQKVERISGPKFGKIEVNKD
jgi:spoIIIJ-associated protein